MGRYQDLCVKTLAKNCAIGWYKELILVMNCGMGWYEDLYINLCEDWRKDFLLVMNWRMGSDLNGSDRGGSTNHSGNHLSNNSPSKCQQILWQRSSSHQFTLSGSPTHYTRGMGNLTTSHLNIFISRENEESPKLFFSSSSNFFVFCHLQVYSWRGRT